MPLPGFKTCKGYNRYKAKIQKMTIPTISDIHQAYSRIKNMVHYTPILSSRAVNQIAGAQIRFKCENFQKVGAFKFRGASNAVFSLSGEEAGRGVVTHSSGNHAQALALAARLRGIKAHIVVPENAPLVKKKAIEGYGANVTYCRPTLQAREETAQAIIDKTGATFIHPYDNPNVIAGQGTAALEILRESERPDIIIAPVGGGGLLSGTAIAVKSLSSSAQVIAAEPLNADDACKSFKTGTFAESQNPKTICDGLLTSLSPRTFSIIRSKVDDIFTAKEETIIRAMRIIWERMKIIVEPSSAVPLAIILENKEFFKNKSIVIIISGGNVELSNLPF